VNLFIFISLCASSSIRHHHLDRHRLRVVYGQIEIIIWTFAENSQQCERVAAARKYLISQSRRRKEERENSHILERHRHELAFSWHSSDSKAIKFVSISPQLHHDFTCLCCG
jgi:hypothetical protein